MFFSLLAPKKEKQFLFTINYLTLSSLLYSLSIWNIYKHIHFLNLLINEIKFTRKKVNISLMYKYRFYLLISAKKVRTSTDHHAIMFSLLLKVRELLRHWERRCPISLGLVKVPKEKELQGDRSKSQYNIRIAWKSGVWPQIT